MSPARLYRGSIAAGGAGGAADGNPREPGTDGADLAYVEAKFTPLGPDWSHHLLLMAAITGGLAIRCDSRLCWSLALSGFAAWRGVAASRVGSELFAPESSRLRIELLVCGLAFAAVGLDWRDHVRSDPSLYRGAVELHDLVGDASKARRVLGWTPEVSFDDLVELLVEADVERLQAESASA